MAAQFVYQPLTGTDLRLISIDPGQFDEPLHIQLHHQPLQTAECIALSYVWGDSVDRLPISVNDVPFPVTKNLFQALRQIRLDIVSDTEPGECIQYVWADAICINQSDEKEKAKEVRRMGSIYQSADHVIG
ncbi:HET-domain-containing protein [Amniculicola lignicola CBS 123094]|uniref:HET-domain-containing protein n=1 Tax=Amniculicola lignicola CBS 123094 TaxID=1392246 RepID=A0A6A5WYG4_9PLEO|nr:HET-domain-containing protein [Amniculicola lignicola CBS 123094]